MGHVAAGDRIAGDASHLVRGRAQGPPERPPGEDVERLGDIPDGVDAGMFVAIRASTAIAPVRPG